MNKFSRAGGPAATLATCFLIVAAMNLACMGFKKPWRDYTEKPFSSAEWLAGDELERGRMMADLFKKRTVGVSTRDETIKTLGEPDLKKTVENREVWLYRMDRGLSEGMDLFPVSFDDKGRGSTGMVKSGSISMAVRERDL